MRTSGLAVHMRFNRPQTRGHALAQVQLPESAKALFSTLVIEIRDDYGHAFRVLPIRLQVVLTQWTFPFEVDYDLFVFRKVKRGARIFDNVTAALLRSFRA